MGTEKSPGFTLYSLSGHVTAPASTRRRWDHLRELLDYAGGVRAGHGAEVLDSGRVVDSAVDRRTPRCATGLRGHGLGRVDAGHQGAADLRRDHLRGARGPALDPVLRPRVLRQVHPCREGTYWLIQIYERLETGGHRGGHRQAARHLRHHLRQVVLRVGRWRGLTDHLVDQVLPRRVRRASGRQAARSTRTPRCWRARRSGGLMTATDRPHGVPPASRWSTSPSTTSRSCAQGHVGDSRRRADGRADPPVLRPSAARPGRRLPAVPGRGRGPAQADGLLHHHVTPTWWCAPSSPPRPPTRPSTA